MQKFSLVFGKCISGSHNEFGTAHHGPGTILFLQTDRLTAIQPLMYRIFITCLQISNVEYGMCLDVAEANDHLVFLERCIRSRRNQEFVYTKDNRILKTNTLCVAADLENDLVYSTYCADKNEKLYWIYDEKVNSFQCIDWPFHSFDLYWFWCRAKQ